MKCGCVFWEFAKRKLATRKDKIKFIKSLPLALSVSREERCEVLACFHVVVKMYRYSLEERVFIVKTYGITGSIYNCQRRFVEQFSGKQAPRISPHDWLTTRAASSWLSLSYLIFSYCQLPFCEFPKHTTALHYRYANVLYFCSFCKPTFSGATREWDAQYKSEEGTNLKDMCWKLNEFRLCNRKALNLSSTMPWSRMGEWMYRATYS
jgi:hypothetical protein